MSIDLSPKLKIMLSEDKEKGRCLLHWCPGCKQAHVINVEKPNHLGAKWSWDGDVNKPTFSPSINIVGSCHYFIQQGKIAYCSDSKHALAGQNVYLPDFPEDW